jgi:hypothetical protein
MKKPRRTKRNLAAIFGCTVALTAAMPAFADDVAGQWLFDTSKFAGNDCQIVGKIFFTPTKVKNTSTCEAELSRRQLHPPAFGQQGRDEWRTLRRATQPERPLLARRRTDFVRRAMAGTG